MGRKVMGADGENSFQVLFKFIRFKRMGLLLSRFVSFK